MHRSLVFLPLFKVIMPQAERSFSADCLEVKKTFSVVSNSSRENKYSRYCKFPHNPILHLVGNMSKIGMQEIRVCLRTEAETRYACTNQILYPVCALSHSKQRQTCILLSSKLYLLLGDVCISESLEKKAAT